MSVYNHKQPILGLNPKSRGEDAGLASAEASIKGIYIVKFEIGFIYKHSMILF
jgi:hypothetical protein